MPTGVDDLPHIVQGIMYPQRGTVGALGEEARQAAEDRARQVHADFVKAYGILPEMQRFTVPRAPHPTEAHEAYQGRMERLRPRCSVLCFSWCSSFIVRHNH